MRSYCRTDVGLKRNMNQDFVYASDQPVGTLPNLYIVADGMGGHAAGDLASRCAVETMVDFIETAKEKRRVRILEEAVQAANRAVYQKSLEDRAYAGMGTTLVAAFLAEECLYIANVGDSRLYLAGESLLQITRDHSLVEEMVRAGQLSREKARMHPEKNVITRAVGMKDRIRVDLFDVDLRPEEIILLCSDGLTNMVPDEEIFGIIAREASLQEAAQKLVETANQNGGSDNISVILIGQEGGGRV